MGGTVSARSSSPAERTVAFLQELALNGRPALIPGAFEKRPPRLVAPSVTRDEPGLVDHIRYVGAPTAARAGPDRQQLEREREGGGAPAERSGSRHLMTRLWRRNLRRVLHN